MCITGVAFYGQDIIGTSYGFEFFVSLCVIRVRTRYGSDGKRHTGIKKKQYPYPALPYGNNCCNRTGSTQDIRTDPDSDPYGS